MGTLLRAASFEQAIKVAFGNNPRAPAYRVVNFPKKSIPTFRTDRSLFPATGESMKCTHRNCWLGPKASFGNNYFFFRSKMDPTADSVRPHVFKEPLGFIRIIQSPMAILAFITTASFSDTIRIPFSCPSTSTPNPKLETKTIDWGYPFDLTNKAVSGNFCDRTYRYGGGTVYPFSIGAESQSQFFVATGILSFLYVLAILSVYLLAWSNYKKDPRYAMGDIAMTGILALFWFIGSCAWASGLTSVKSVTDPQTIGQQLRGSKGSFPCNVTKECTPTEWPNFATLNVSVIAGFACFGLWLANLWFIYKETAWYKNRTANAAGHGATGIPTGQQPSMGSQIGGPNVRSPTSDFQY